MAPISRPRLLLADDHQIVIEGLCTLLEPEFEIVGFALDGPGMVHSAAQLHPDMVIADVNMPGLSGVEASRQILKSDPDTRIVFLSMHDEVHYVTEALDAGAWGYVLKSSAGRELVTAVHEVLLGRVFVSPSISAESIRVRAGRAPEPRDGPALLTARQKEVVRLIAEGRTTKDIAAILDVSVRTVEFHKYRAMEILGLNSLAQLVQYSVRHL
jgi:DNA-binding NarL/FixJ family response regulator